MENMKGEVFYIIIQAKLNIMDILKIMNIMDLEINMIIIIN